jgi:hypothetical protein
VIACRMAVAEATPPGCPQATVEQLPVLEDRIT